MLRLQPAYSRVYQQQTICVWEGALPISSRWPQLCAATSIFTSQPDCISNSKFQQKTHNCPCATYISRFLASFPHKSLNLPTSYLLFHFPATCFAPNHSMILWLYIITFSSQQSRGSFWPERHFDGQGRKGGTEWAVLGSSFSHDVYNLCFPFVAKGEKMLYG